MTATGYERQFSRTVFFVTWDVITFAVAIGQFPVRLSPANSQTKRAYIGGSRDLRALLRMED